MRPPGVRRHAHPAQVGHGGRVSLSAELRSLAGTRDRSGFLPAVCPSTAGGGTWGRVSLPGTSNRCMYAQPVGISSPSCPQSTTGGGRPCLCSRAAWSTPQGHGSPGSPHLATVRSVGAPVPRRRKDRAGGRCPLRNPHKPWPPESHLPEAGHEVAEGPAPAPKTQNPGATRRPPRG
jgi:hypothetical protein